MGGRLLALLGAAALVEILAFLLLRDPQPAAMTAYRILHLAEMLALIALVGLESAGRGRVARLVLAGLLLSFVGDVINSHLLDLSSILQPQTLLSIPPFAAAHLCYIAAFVAIIRGASTQPLPWAPFTVLGPMLALGLWWLLIDRSAPPLLLKLSLGYAFVVTLMGLTALLLGLRLGGHAWLPAVGGLVFVVSDAILGSYLLDGPQRPLLASQAIWATYFLAQGLVSRVFVLR
jgi:uncharacterized membrane protein YhhN